MAWKCVVCGASNAEAIGQCAECGLTIYVSAQTEESMNKKDRDEFRLYLRQCTDRQVQGVYDKESAAGREDYAELAENEAERRGITLERSR